MAIKQSTQDKIEAALRNDVASWQVFGCYEFAYPCRNCACGHAIQNVFVLCRKGDHGPDFGEMDEIGSECIKFVAKVSPDLYKWLLNEKAEMDRIKRQMKKKREDEFHASETWKELSRGLYALNTILRVFNPSAFYGRTLLSLGINYNQFVGGLALRSIGDNLTKVTYGKLHFEDETRPTAMLKTAESLIAEFIEFCRPFKAELEAKAASVPSNSPAGSIVNALLARM